MTPNPTQAAGESLPVSDFPPLPGDSALERGNFFVDAVTVLPQENRPGAYRLAVEGSLPTPCNQLRVQVNPPDAQGNIVVDVYSVVDPAQLCTQVLKPFAGFVATLGGYPPGNYNVVVNDQPPVKIEIK